jgi:DNA repair protein RadC
LPESSSCPLYRFSPIAMGISDWPESERPREKLLKNGPQNLSNSELLAIFLRTGIAGKSAVDLARELLQRFGGITGMFAADQHAFCEVPGMGPAKYAQLQAVLEMARRALEEKLKSRDILSSPESVREYLRLSLQGKQHEVFVGIFLDAQNRTIATEELFNGTLTQASVYPREIVKRALHHNAAAMIFAHNHPSGLAEPSQADEVLTRSLKQALALVDVKVLDHFVVGSDSAMSFAERGLI